MQSSGLWSLKQDSISGGAEHIHVKKNLLYGECYLRWNGAGLEAKYTLEPKPYTHNTHKQINKVHYYSRTIHLEKKSNILFILFLSYKTPHPSYLHHTPFI